MPQCASPQARLLVLVFTSATEHPTEPIDVIFRARDPCSARTLLTLDLGRNVDLTARLLLAGKPPLSLFAEISEMAGAEVGIGATAARQDNQGELNPSTTDQPVQTT